MAEWSDDIDELAQVLRVYKALGAEREVKIHDLVTPYRRFIRQESVDVKIAPFSANKCHPSNLFLFRDVLIIADDANNLTPSGETSSSNKWLSTLANQGKRISRRLSSSSGGRRASEERSVASDASGPAPYKLTHRLDLEKCTIKRASSNHHEGGFQLTHVYRARDAKGKPATRIDMVEVWCSSAEQADELFEIIDEQIEQTHASHEEVEASHIQDGSVSDASSATESTTTDGAPIRSWAKAKRNIRRHNSSRRTLASSGASAVSEDSDDGGHRRFSAASGSTDGGHESDSGLSLSDLESRYKVNVKDEDRHEAEFTVVFGEGPMGFSLSSSAGLGVIVGRLADHSMAEFGGVEIGDRLIKIGDTEITLDMPWRDAVEVIKSAPRPVELKFMRNFTVNSHIQRAEARKQRASARRAASTARAGRASTRTARCTMDRSDSGASDGQRSWMRRRHNRSFGTRIISLDELESMYRKTGTERATDEDTTDVFEYLANSESDHVRACANTLGEIFKTECDYVRDLRVIVGDYLLPIRRTVHHVRCKDVTAGSTFCEHHQPRLTCHKMSRDTTPILEAHEIREIFINLEMLVKVNAELLDVLNGKVQEAVDSRGVENVTITDLVRIFAPAFTRVMPFFRIYSLYCHQYTAAQDKLLRSRLKNKTLDDLIKQREAKTHTSLMHLLIKPVQRICKYPLLFQALLKSVVPYVNDEILAGADVDNLDELVKELSNAMSTVDKIAKSVDQKVGEQENLGKMMQVYTELGGETAVPGLIAPSRRFVDNFEILLRQPPFEDLEEPIQHRLYMFNDHLVFAMHQPVGYHGSGSGSLRRLHSKKSLKKSTAGSKRTTTSSLHSKMNLFRRTSSKSTHSTESDKRSSGGGSTASAHITRTSRSTTGSSNSFGHHSSNGALRALAGAITLRADLHKCSIKNIEEPDEAECFGFVMSYVTRVVDEHDHDEGDDKTHLHRADSGRTIQTMIGKVQIWLATHEERDQLVRILTAQIDNLQRLEDTTKEATQSVGPKVKERNWRKLTKTRGNTNRISRYATAHYSP